jgi:hypothetical protein
MKCYSARCQWPRLLGARIFQIRDQALVLLILTLGPNVAQAVTAVERFQALQEKLRTSRSSHDWQSSLATAKELEQFLNGSADSVLETARAEVHLNDLTAAARKL